MSGCTYSKTKRFDEVLNKVGLVCGDLLNSLDVNVTSDGAVLELAEDILLKREKIQVVTFLSLRELRKRVSDDALQF